MKKILLSNMTVKQLVEHFKSIALAQAHAIEFEANRNFNKLYDEMEAVRRELKSREGDQRRALLPLLQERSAQVRLKAAISLLKLEPAAARAALVKIVDNREDPQNADALGMLRSLEQGRYVPD